MKERLNELLAYLGIGQNKFEDIVGVSRGYVNKLGGNITMKTLDKIIAAYPELNKNWLLTGEGEMLRAGQETPQGQSAQAPGELDIHGLIESFKDVAAAAKAATQTAQSLASSVECLLARLDNERASTTAAMSSPGPVMRAAR